MHKFQVNLTYSNSLFAKAVENTNETVFNDRICFIDSLTAEKTSGSGENLIKSDKNLTYKGARCHRDNPRLSDSNRAKIYGETKFFETN